MLTVCNENKNRHTKVIRIRLSNFSVGLYRIYYSIFYLFIAFISEYFIKCAWPCKTLSTSGHILISQIFEYNFTSIILFDVKVDIERNSFLLLLQTGFRKPFKKKLLQNRLYSTLLYWLFLCLPAYFSSESILHI